MKMKVPVTHPVEDLTQLHIRAAEVAKQFRDMEREAGSDTEWWLAESPELAERLRDLTKTQDVSLPAAMELGRDIKRTLKTPKGDPFWELYYLGERLTELLKNQKGNQP
jgi:hypothetical protein